MLTILPNVTRASAYIQDMIHLIFSYIKNIMYVCMENFRLPSDIYLVSTITAAFILVIFATRSARNIMRIIILKHIKNLSL